MKKRILYGLLCIFVLIGLTACGSKEEGVEVKSASALTRKLANDSTAKINVSEDIVLDEPIVVRGEKELVGKGTITAAIADSEESYMITVADGAKLTVGGSVKIDAAGIIGGIHVQSGAKTIVQDKATVKSASEEAANALVEGSFEVKGGKLEDAKGHNIYNMKETVVSGGEITGSGAKYAGIYNEGTLTQNGGTVSKAYNNISNVKGSTFTFEGGTNADSTRDGIFVAEGATLKATKKEATVDNAGGKGILLLGQADIKLITVKDCGDTLIKVGKNGVLNLGNGVLQGGNYHGVDNAGTMNMMGGNIQMNKNCGIVNTGTLKVTSGSISNNSNKGILNKHEGKADVTSAMLTLTSNKIAIGNEDKAVLDFSKAKVLMSTQTNIFCYDGTVNIYDATLNASTSNNVRITGGTINMKNVEVNGNSQKSNTSHHGIYMEGGTINAENVTVSMTTGCGIRNKGGVFNGKNIVMHDINRIAVSQGKHDYLKVEGLTDITGLEIQSTNFANVLNEGGGTVKIRNAKLAVASSNSVRANDGRIELTNVTIPGHKPEMKNNIHGIYMEGGEIVANNVSISNTTGNGIRNKNGKFYGKNITISNPKGDTAISNLPLDTDHKDGIIDIDTLKVTGAFSKNITLDSGVTTIRNATLGKTGGNNIKMQGDAATLNLYNVDIEGQREDAANSTHGIMLEGGHVNGEDIRITDVNAHGIRCKWGTVDLKNVAISKTGQIGISNSSMKKNGQTVVGNLKIDGLTVKDVGGNNVLVDAGTAVIKNAVLTKITTNNHNVKVSGTGSLTLEKTKVEGETSTSKYGLIVEGGNLALKDVEIYDVARSAIHANKATSNITGTNVIVKDTNTAITGSNGKITIDGFETINIKENNMSVTGVDVTIKNGTLCTTKGHNAKATGASLVTLENTVVNGVSKDAPSDKRIIMAEGGDYNLIDVTIIDVSEKTNAIHVNNANSLVIGKNVTIINSNNGIYSSNGEVVIDNLITEGTKNNNVLTSSKGHVTVVNSELSIPAGHNLKSEGGLITLENVKVLGVSDSSKHVLMAEGGSFDLTEVEITNGLNAAIRINKATSSVTGKDVTITDSVYAVSGTAGTVEIDGLTTSNVTTNNLLAESSCEITVSNGDLCQLTKGHNVKATGSAVITLTDVEVKGTSSASHHGIMAEGGDFKLENVTISGVTANANGGGIYINTASSEVTGKNVTIVDCTNGIFGTNGEVTIDKLVTDGIKNNNVLTRSSAKVTVKNSELSIPGGHNVKSEGGLIALENVILPGVVDSSKHVVMAEGGNFDLKGVEISNAKNAAVRINKATSTVTGKDVTIADSANGITGTAGTVNIEGLTAAGVTGNNLLAESTCQISVTDGDLCQTTGGHNVKATGTAVIELTNTEVKGTSSASHHAIMAEGGNFVLNNVTISGVTKNTGGAGIRINNASSTITGADVTISECRNGITGTAGTVDIEGFTTTGIEVNNLLAESKCAITIENGDLCQTPNDHNVKTIGTATIALSNTEVKGTAGADCHAVMAAGGNVELDNVTISGAKASDASAAICVEGASTTVIARDIKVKDVANGVICTDGTVEVENIDLSNVTGENIWTNSTLKIAGVVKANIHVDAAKTVTATKALTGSKITLDWAEGKLPADLVGIQFANAEDASASEGTVLLGEVAGENYIPYYLGAQMILTDRTNTTFKVTNYAELLEALAFMDDNDITNAIITIAGDIIVEDEIVIDAGKDVRMIDDGTVRTISRPASYTKGNLFKVESGARLALASTSNDNESIKLKVDGGSANATPVITGTDSSLVRNEGVLTVGSGVKFANAKGSTSYCKALAIFAEAGSTTNFSGVIDSMVGQYTAASGYGIAITVSTVDDFVLDNAIVKNNFTYGTGVIRLEAGGKLTIKNTTFENNESVTQAGVISDSGNAQNRLAIEDSSFIENKTSGNAGAIHISTAAKDNVTITGTTFTGNKANQGAAIDMLTGASLTIADCEFIDNVTTDTSTTDSKCGYGDIRLGNHSGSGGIYISGKMIVDIYMNQAGKVDVVGELTDGSKVVANWRLDKITAASWVGIRYASADVMNASKEYISLSDNYNGTYVIKNEGTTGTLVKPTPVTNETELKNAIAAIEQTTGKSGFIQIAKDFTISAVVNIPAGVDVTIVDNGEARTIKRATKDITLFDVKAGGSLTLQSTSNDNENPTLTIDGASATITNSNAASLINASGTTYVGKGVALTNNKSTGNNQGFGIYSQAGSDTTFCGVLSNIVGTHASVKGNALVIKGTFTLKDAIVKDNVAVAGAPIRLQGGQLTAINTVFEGNTTNGNAGVLYTETTAGNVLLIDGCTFISNIAGGDGGAISIENTFDTNTIKNSKFIDNTANAGGAINLKTGAFINLENCEFSGNKTTNTGTSESKSGYGDIRVADNNQGGGAIRISGKMIADIYLNQAGRIDVVGPLTEGSKVIANWRLTKITAASWTGINFASADDMEASKGYFELSANYKDTYNLTFSGTSGILQKK